MITPSTKIKHYLQVADLTLEEYDYVMQRARIIKQKFKHFFKF